MRRLSAVLALTLAASGGPALAQDDLLGIYRLARESDPVFQQAIADRRAREEALPQARSALRPDVEATGGYDWVDSESDPTAGTAFEGSNDDTYQELSYGVQLNQPLFRYSAARSVEQADASVEQAQADFAFAEQELVLRVAERYFAVLDARERVEASRANLEAIERQLEQARERFEVGVVARTDVEEAQAQFDLASAELLQAEDDLQTEREQLRELTDRPPEALAQVREGVRLDRPQPDDPDAWRRRAEEQNWQLTSARRAAEAAMVGIDVERGGHYPTVDLVAAYQGGEQFDRNGRDISSDELRLGVQLTVPLYQGGEVSSRVREAQFRYTEARELLEETRRTVRRNAADAYRGVVTALQRVRALDQARTSTRAALDATEAGFEVGTRTIVDVLNAQREVFNAERDYQQARHAYLLNTLRLQQAAGLLAEDDIIRINRLLEASDA
ncbi:TolC family outer membrane protein [Sediminicurvatus halobius]|uniref:Type I secretion protein TolC n=1 Tax=Sediminicurvatus halobius TaxID=2182432 RepID=A0A2U2N7E6_9GAMM|nr:TolC family outer membrane protein [Spiribacter halobius]PWG64894.1 type I secretion protein TolC [Spiribacter halobius]UEX78251.1 TolC family outer membrane protein [Spiribacter halobius]